MPLQLPRGVRPVADPPIERLPGLEQTRFDDVLTMGTDVVPGFEQTLQDRAPEVIPDYIPGFEATATEELIELPGSTPAPMIPGIERTAQEFDRTPPAPTGVPVNCPYCGFAQATGKICNSCGRSKQRFVPSRPESGAYGGDEETVRCRSCGAKVKHHKLCSECGSQLPPFE